MNQTTQSADQRWVEIHESLGHKVAENCYRCLTCGQTYEQYMIMSPTERSIWISRSMP
jgi:hypothetical protein